MVITTKFKVTARCNVYEKDMNAVGNSSYNEEDFRKIDFTIALDEEKARNFIFRCGERYFTVGEYRVAIRENGNHMPVIQMVNSKDNTMLIIMNTEQFMNQVLEGYTRLVALHKINSMFEFDFDTAIEAQDLQFIEEEF